MTHDAAVQLTGGTTEIVSSRQAYLASGSSISAEPVYLANSGTTATEPSAAADQGRAVDGYISGATVFADANGDGLLSPGEASAITDSLGRYNFTTTASGPVILTGGTDVATGLPFTQTLTAPAGSLTITPLTTLVQKIEAINGGNLVNAKRQVNAEFGLAADTEMTALDSLRSAAAGSSNGAAANIAGVIVAKTVALATTAGATGDLYAKLAAQVAANPVSFDPASVAAMQVLGLTGAATMSDSAVDTIGAVAGGAGDLTVSARGMVTDAGLIVGGAGAGSLRIGAGGTMSSSAGIDLAASLGSTGSEVVAGAAAVLSNTGTFVAGDAGLGSLAIDAAGSVASTSGGLMIANTSAASGSSVNVSGAITGNGSGGFNIVIDTPTIYSNVTLNGTIKNGTWNINAAGGALTPNTDSVTNQTFVFADNTGTLVIGTDQLATILTPPSGISNFTTVTNPNLELDLIGGFQGTIAGFAAGDQIVIDTARPASLNPNPVNATQLLVEDNINGATEGTLTFATAAMAMLAYGGLTAVACYATGTSIETVDGPRSVETLRAGDEVVTLLGGPGRIVWVGSRTVDCAHHPRPESLWPVCIREGAFGAGDAGAGSVCVAGSRDLCRWCADPGEVLDQRGSVRQVKRRTVTYHHIELEQHDVVLAEGLPAETYLDTGDRARFAGGAVQTLYPDFGGAASIASAWEMTGSAFDGVWGDVGERAAEVGGRSTNEKCSLTESREIPAVRPGHSRSTRLMK